jgi:hypothetical protein
MFLSSSASAHLRPFHFRTMALILLSIFHFISLGLGNLLTSLRSQQKIFTSGRGGAGNMRSPRHQIPQRTPRRSQTSPRVWNRTRQCRSQRWGSPISWTWRCSNSRSRDSAAVGNNGVTPLHSSGRGGYGNFETDESSTTLGRLAEKEDRKVVDERHDRERKEGQG